MSDKKIIMLIQQDWEYPKMVYQSLKEEFIIDSVIVERGESVLRVIKRRIKKLGLIKVVGQILFKLTVNLYINLTSKNRIREILKNNNIKTTTLDSVKTFEVTSLNSEKSHNILKGLNADIAIIVTKTILSKETLTLTKTKFVNIHAGITPIYRGWHGAYWALINNDSRNCGVTVHFVDEGIDTGDILYQETIIDSLTPKDNIMSYTILQLVKALPLLKKALRDIQNNSIKTKEIKQITSGLYYQPTLWFYLYHRWFNKIK